MATTLTEFPSRFAAGTTLLLTLSYPDFPASAGWALTLYLNGRSTLNKAGVANGDAFDVTLTATETGPLLAGTYTRIARVKKGAEEYNADSGQIVITPNVVTATAGAFLSYEEKTLAAIEAHQTGRLSKAQEGYTIDGIQIVNWDPADPDLEKLRVKFQTAVNRQRNGGQGMRTHRLRFRQES